MAAPLSPPLDIPAIVAELTVDEKASLLSGRDFWTTSPVPRLGVGSLKLSDGPNGARGGDFLGVSACFPASVAVAATWDKSLAERIGGALADETKSKGASVLLAPTICPHRDPRGGRNFESFSEDPLLAGILAAQLIRGLQDEGVGATIKHFAGNEQETRRFTMNAQISQRALREIYLKPFEIAVKTADPWAIMTSYNLVNGTHADMSEFLISEVLRKQWGFKGLVMSDWGGTNSGPESLAAGLDLEMPGPTRWRSTDQIKAALQSSELSMATLDERVTKVLELVARAGRFNAGEVPEEKSLDLPERRQLIREAAAEGMVLLKNSHDILPLKKDKLGSIAVLGLAKEYLGHGGGSAGLRSHHQVTLYDALSDALGGKVKLNYAPGPELRRTLDALSTDVFDNEGAPGLTQYAYKTEDKSDEPEISNVPTAFFNSFQSPQVQAVTLSATFRPAKSGRHYLKASTLGNSSLFINDVKVWECEGQGAQCMAFLLGFADECDLQYDFEAGTEYKIRLEARGVVDTVTNFAPLGHPMVGVNLGIVRIDDYDRDFIGPAVEAAKASDVAVIHVGHLPSWETEGGDRETMNLPKGGSLDQLIEAVAAANPNTIVINSTGSPVSMPWLDNIAALVQAWFPGQEAGHSIVDVLLGNTCPGGKLPVTFPKSLSDVPTVDNFPGDLSRNIVEYKEDIFIGYRHYDRHPAGTLFPFGHGLSYTRFQVCKVDISGDHFQQGAPLTITAEVRNVGLVSGSEVLQLYVSPELLSQSTDRPLKQLCSFSKVQLKPGEAASTSMTIDKESLAYWSEEKNKWVVDRGFYRAYLGTSSVNIRAVLDFVTRESFEYEP